MGRLSALLQCGHSFLPSLLGTAPTVLDAGMNRGSSAGR